MQTNQTILSSLIAALCSAKADIDAQLELQTPEVKNMYAQDAIRKLDQALQHAYSIDPIALHNEAVEAVEQATKQDRSYNGWSNYATWNVNLWLSNDANEQWPELAKEYIQDQIDNGNTDLEDVRATATYQLSQAIKAEVEEFQPDLEASMYSDLLGSALSDVNWYEIAEHYTEEIELFSAGWNMPGYMPESDLSLFTAFDDAKASIYESMEQELESLEDESITEDSEEFTQVRQAREPFNVKFGKFAYWVAKV